MRQGRRPVVGVGTTQDPRYPSNSAGPTSHDPSLFPNMDQVGGLCHEHSIPLFFFHCLFEPPALSQVLGLALGTEPILYMGPKGSARGEDVGGTAGKAETGGWGGPVGQQLPGCPEISQGPFLGGGGCWTSGPP